VRLRLDLAYDGTDFHGWATQPGLRTVQGTLEDALAQILRVERVPVTCAGRTDTGVHARGQVVHFDVPGATLGGLLRSSTTNPVDVLLRRLNGILSKDVRVLRSQAAPAGFDARFSASWRRYAYRVADAPHLVDPLVRRMVLAWPRSLDLAAMNEAAASLTGEHDFSAFCRRRDGATTVRTLHELSWTRDANGLAVTRVRADAFCHNMVRSLVGCLLAVGERRKDPRWAGEVLARGKRDSGVTVARAHGLTLEEVAYPADDQVAARAKTARTVRAVPGRGPAFDE